MGRGSGCDQGHQPPQPCARASTFERVNRPAAHAARKAAGADRILVLWLIGSQSKFPGALTPGRTESLENFPTRDYGYTGLGGQLSAIAAPVAFPRYTSP